MTKTMAIIALCFIGIAVVGRIVTTTIEIIELIGYIKSRNKNKENRRIKKC